MRGAPILVRIRVLSLGRPAKGGTPGASGTTRPSLCAPDFSITGPRSIGGRESSFPPVRGRRRGCGVMSLLKILGKPALQSSEGGDRIVLLFFFCNLIFVSSFFVITRTFCKYYTQYLIKKFVVFEYYVGLRVLAINQIGHSFGLVPRIFPCLLRPDGWPKRVLPSCNRDLSF